MNNRREMKRKVQNARPTSASLMYTLLPCSIVVFAVTVCVLCMMMDAIIQSEWQAVALMWTAEALLTIEDAWKQSKSCNINRDMPAYLFHIQAVNEHY